MVGGNKVVYIHCQVNSPVSNSSWPINKSAEGLYVQVSPRQIPATRCIYLFICTYLFATQLQLQKDAKKKIVGRNGEEA